MRYLWLCLRYFRSDNQNLNDFYFVYLSLNRTFALCRRYFRSEIKIKTPFILVFLSLNRTFAPKITKKKEK